MELFARKAQNKQLHTKDTTVHPMQWKQAPPHITDALLAAGWAKVTIVQYAIVSLAQGIVTVQGHMMYRTIVYEFSYSVYIARLCVQL